MLLRCSEGRTVDLGVIYVLSGWGMSCIKLECSMVCRCASGGQRIEKRSHARNFCPLIGIHLGRETKNLCLLAGAGGAEQACDHHQRSLVMADHVPEEELVELVAVRICQLRQLFA